MAYQYSAPVAPYSSTIAELLAHQGDPQARAAEITAAARAQAALQSGAAWGSAIQGIGNNISGAIQTATDPRRKLEGLQYDETKKNIAEADQVKALIRKTPLADLGGGVMGYDLPVMTKAVSDLGGDPSVLISHIGPVNEALQQFHAGRMGTVQAGAKALQASGNDPDLAGDFFDVLEKNGVASPAQLTQYRAMAKTTEGVAKLTALFAGPQKYGSAAPGSGVLNETTGRIVPGQGVPDKPTVVPAGASLVDSGAGPGSPLPGAGTPLPRVLFSSPPAPTTAGNEKVIRDLYAKQASGAAMTPEELSAIKGYEAEKSGNDAPVTVKTMENGKPVEKLMTRAQALAAGQFPSQPPASVQVLNQMGGSGGEASAGEKAIGNYMIAPPSPRSLATPGGKAMMDRVLAYNPDYDASKFSVRAPTRKAFTTGTQGQQITAMNTAIEHLDQLQGAADALKNGEFKPGNAAYQALKATFGDSAPTNYDTIKAMVDKEVEAVANKGVPTVSGTAEQKALAGRSASPEQLKGYINTLIPLMGSKLNALHYQYTQAMGANDPFTPITPQAQNILTQRGFDPTTANAKPAGAGVGGTVKMRAPDGQMKDVPADQVEHFKALGAKVVGG